MTDRSELTGQDAVAQADLRRRGSVGPTELVEAAIERAAAVDGTINSIVYPRDERAVEQAAMIPVDGPPLAGVPMAVKDWKCLQAGERWSWSMRVLDELELRAEFSTELARRYEAAGLVSIGRTNLPELAFGPPTTEPDAHGPCRNPWATGYSVGGSSGGSAAAVAAGIVPVANASDGGGSLRIPAACCGVLGLKVSSGRIPNAPHADGRNIKVEGTLATSVRDLAITLDLTSGPLVGAIGTPPRPSDGFARSLAGAAGGARRRIVVRTTPPLAMSRGHDTSCVDDEHIASVHHIARVLEAAGHHVEEGVGPDGLDERLGTPNLYAAERAALRATIEEQLGRPLERDDVEPRTWAMFELAANATGPQVLAELGNEQRWAAAVRRWWTEPTDVLLTPTLGRSTPAIGELKETDDEPFAGAVAGFPMAWFTYPFNLTGQPALSVPAGLDRNGVPIGVQLVGAWGREDVLLGLAGEIERAAPWPTRAPLDRSAASDRPSEPASTPEPTP
ncbi:MAG: amidase [Actinomycetota bacterium]